MEEQTFSTYAWYHRKPLGIMLNDIFGSRYGKVACDAIYAICYTKK